MDLLEKASIILTPTAYNNGEALCVKPSDGSGDFDFSRNSAATRVNAQGLVENVQILSGNLVQNGDFSEEGAEEVSNGSFSQEGAEQVTNGSFDTDSDWIKGTGWSISGGKAISNGTSGNLYQSGIIVTGKQYKIQATVSDYVSGNVEVSAGAVPRGTMSANGTYTFYQTASSTSNLFIISNSFEGSIDNVSVREVGQDWTFGTGWSVGEDKAINDGTSGFLIQSNILTIGKTYKITYTLLNVASGKLRFREAGVNGTPRTSNGTYTDYITAASTRIAFQAYDGFNGSITNISVKEVGQNWVFSSGAFITDIGARLTHTPTAGTITSLGYSPLVIGNNYKMTYEITESISGGIKLNSAVVNTMVSTIGIHTKYFEATGNSISFARTDPSGNDVTIDNISVIEITDDTNLPRINYEGFSYQDALGSELLADGNIINSGGGSFTFTPNGLTAISDGTSGSIARPIIVWNTLTIGKQYRIVGTPTINSGNTNYALYDGATYVKNQVAVEAFDITFTCEGSSVFFTNDGTQTFDIDWDLSIKEYLGQEVVPDSGCGSWLFEPQSTNLLPYSEDFTSWNGYQATSNTTTSPSANSVLFLDFEDARMFPTNNVASGVEYTSSIYLKANKVADVKIRNVRGQDTIFTLTTDWVRYELTATTNSTSTNALLIDARFSEGLGASGLEIALWGGQIEQQSYATSYIPTNGEANGVTRNQDVCNNGGSLASINSTEGVLYAEIAALADDLTLRSISLSDGTTNNVATIRYRTNSNRIQVVVFSGGVLQFSNSYDVTNILDFNKVAISYNQSDFNYWVNGVKRASSTSGNTPIGMNKLSFDNGGSHPFYGKTKALAVWKEALSDSELQSLTTI